MKYKTINGETLRKALLSAQSNLEANKDLVNGLNVFPVPDGDTGTNMGLTVSSAIKHLRELENPTIAEVAKAAGAGALMGARGNSGVILSQLFRGFASGMKGLEKADVADMARALDMAAKMAYKAVMRPTEGTVLTVARVMGEFALQNYKKYDDVTMFLTDVREKGEETLEKTPEMLAVLAEAGVVDAGGKGLLCLFEGALAYLKTGKEAVAEPAPAPVTVQKTSAPAESSADIPFGYCTEFMIMGNSAGFEKFRDELETFGDSIVAVQGDDVIKIHIHTNHPGQVLEKAMALRSAQRHQNRQYAVPTRTPARRRRRSRSGVASRAIGRAGEKIRLRHRGVRRRTLRNIQRFASRRSNPRRTDHESVDGRFYPMHRQNPRRDDYSLAEQQQYHLGGKPGQGSV